MGPTRMSRTAGKGEFGTAGQIITKEGAHRMPREASEVSMTSGKEGHEVTLTHTNYRKKDGSGRPDFDHVFSHMRLFY